MDAFLTLFLLSLLPLIPLFFLFSFLSFFFSFCLHSFSSYFFTFFFSSFRVLIFLSFSLSLFGNQGVLRIPQSSSITGSSLSDCLWSYQETVVISLSLFFSVHSSTLLYKYHRALIKRNFTIFSNTTPITSMSLRMDPRTMVGQRARLFWTKQFLRKFFQGKALSS